MTEEYSESTIKVLEGTEGVRLRPAMYIGDIGTRGLHHLVYEVIDNSIDEAMAGRCSKVDVTIYEDGSISIKDDGAGVPADIHPIYGVPTLELILTKLHSGGKFEKKAYQVSGGLHGIGLAAVCALSSYFKIESFRNGMVYSQEYAMGKKVTEVSKNVSDEPSGTLIHFKPDETIFTDIVFDFNTLANRFRELAFLTSFFTINFIDKRKLKSKRKSREDLVIHGVVSNKGEKSVSFYYERGLLDFIDHLAKDKGDIVGGNSIFYTKKEHDGVIVEISFKYTEAYNETILGYVNNINTHEGGTHISGFRTVLTRRMNKFGETYNLFGKNNKSLNGNDIREGISAIISVKVPNPQFEGQTKTKLGNSEVDGIVQHAIKEPLDDFLALNQKLGKAIIDMRGKVLNVEKSRVDKALQNNEINNIITAVGTDYLDDFKINKVRYGKIILLTDADVDGQHIATLLFTFFYRYLRPLIEHGLLYIARPPLYKVNIIGSEAKVFFKNLYGNTTYLQKENDRINLLKKAEEKGIDKTKFTFNRFKGLGEMNADQLKETAMDPNTRNIERVTIEDALESEEWLIKLMGDDVSARKKFIKQGVFDEDDSAKGEFYKNAFTVSENPIN
ncbi:DNA topoisomerase IV subunit B [archaeon]|nr:DNA topoisomerase IV subunit B [archaeon]